MMPPAVYTQSIIALIWDFDKTLTHGYMQDPLFDRFGVSAKTFWDEVNGLKEHYGQRGYMIASDTIYLNHILTNLALDHSVPDEPWRLCLRGERRRPGMVRCPRAAATRSPCGPHRNAQFGITLRTLRFTSKPGLIAGLLFAP